MRPPVARALQRDASTRQDLGKTDAVEPQPSQLIGRRLADRYVVERLIGRGGMADVFDAHDDRLGRQVAVKILRPEFQADVPFRHRFETEGRSAARLAHPNVVVVYDVGEDGDLSYLVMELLGDETLATRIDKRPLSEESARRVGLEVLAALAAAHVAGVLHRDVKPGNVLFAADGSAKLADFGIAKALEIDGAPDDSTKTAMVLGTPAYLAPERVEGASGSPASDLWSVGVLLYEALTGVKPFARQTAIATAMAAREGTAAPLDALRPGISPGFVTVIDRALRPQPSERFSSAGDMADALQSVSLADAPVTVPRPPTDDSAAARTVASAAVPGAALLAPTAVRTVAAAVPARDRNAQPWRRWYPLVGVVIAGLAVVVVVLLVSSGHRDQRPPRRTASHVVTSTTLPTSTTTSVSPTTTTTAPSTTTTTPPTSTTVPPTPTTAVPATTGTPGNPPTTPQGPATSPPGATAPSGPGLQPGPTP